MNAALVMFKADGSRREFALRDGATVVGRKNSCDLRIPLTSVSRQHCEFRVEGAGVKLRDLGSSNGTFRNGVRVQEADLNPGDSVVVGPVQFTLTVDGQPAEVEPVRTVLEAAAPPAAAVAAAATEEAETVDVPPLPPSMQMADAAASQADVATPDQLDDSLGLDEGLDDDLLGDAGGSDGGTPNDDSDDLAAAMASMEDDPDGSSGIAFDFDDDGDDDDMPSIEFLDDDEDK